MKKLYPTTNEWQACFAWLPVYFENGWVWCRKLKRRRTDSWVKWVYDGSMHGMVGEGWDFITMEANSVGT